MTRISATAFFSPHDFDFATQRGRVLPGGMNPEHPLPVTNLEKSRRLPTGASPVSTTRGYAWF